MRNLSNREGTLPLIVILAIIAVIVLVVGSVVLWLLGLIVAFVFFVIGVMLLYALHKTEALNVEEQPWLVILPVAMFFVGLGLDKVGVLSLLQFQPLDFSLAGLPCTLDFQTVLLIIVLILLIIDIAVSKR